MELTWVAVSASLLMALGAVCVFIYAVKRDYFRDIEDVKYQVFWSDWEEEPQPQDKRPSESDRRIDDAWVERTER